ncbi:UNVERIFIED_CONTAM: hypothetical protein RMT77_009747 [Armadillidium vulgare]
MGSQGAHPACLFLTLTLLVTVTATAILVTAILTNHWEEIYFDSKLVEEITASKNNTHKLTWLMGGKVAKVEILQNTPRLIQEDLSPRDEFEQLPWLESERRTRKTYVRSTSNRRYRRQASRVIFLVPLHGGIWTLCVGLEIAEQKELERRGYPFRGCINYLSAGGGGGGSTMSEKSEWIQRMQNLSISCSLVSCILLGASAIVGLFGIIQRQISAVLITGVMYILATAFGLFCLSIMHFKRKTKRDCGILDSQVTEEYTKAMVLENGWSLELGWGGVITCLGASLLWLLLAKIMRYNPISLS